MNYDFDIIVVGSGAGGAALAHYCASVGKSVLVVERGKTITRPNTDRPLTEQDEHEALIEKKPYDDRMIEVNGTSRTLYAGGVVGGSTALFGAVLLRPSPEDFHPGRHYGDRLPRSLWDWPINYEQMKPHYDEAEKLCSLNSHKNENYGPIPAPSTETNNCLIPLAAVNQRLISANQAGGLKPFRLPLAINPAHCLGCSACPGHICPTGARYSAEQLLDPSKTRYAIQLLPETEACELRLGSRGEISGIHLNNRQTGEKKFLKAKRYVLAAGALGTPGLLLRSSVKHPQLGRNYMQHLSPIVAGIFLRSTEATEQFIKQVGFTDFYFGTKSFPHKMGLVQSLPVPGPLMMAKSGLQRWPRRILHSIRKRMLPICGIVEDLPSPQNRVMLDKAGRLKLQHRFGDFDQVRGLHLRKEMKLILKRAGAIYCAGRDMPSAEHVAHQCGTARFGHNPREAVVNADCRSFQSENLFIADGSILPTSLGVGPALTIIANALRVARIVEKEI